MERLLDYFTNHPLLAGAAVVMVFFVLAFELRRRGEGAATIAPNDAIRIMNGGAVLVDLRSANLYKDGHIEGAKSIPSDQIAADPKALERLAGKTIVLYCDNGSTTGAALRALTRAGAGARPKDVYGLRGGLAAWKQENLPVVKG